MVIFGNCDLLVNRPDLNFNLLSQFVNNDNQTEAVIAYRDALQN